MTSPVSAPEDTRNGLSVAEAVAQQTAGQRAVSSFAARLGLGSTAGVTYIDPAWSALLLRGGVMKLSIGRMRFKTKTSPADFGISPQTPEEASAWRAVARDLGKRPLVPEKIMQDFERDEGEARSAVEARSIRLFDGATRFLHEGKPFCNVCRRDVPDEDDSVEFPLQAHTRQAHPERVEFVLAEDGRYVLNEDGSPMTTVRTDGRERGWNYLELVAILETIRARYMARAVELIDKLPEYQQELVGHYAVMASRAYGEMLRAGVKNLPDQETFIKDRVADLLRINETPEAIRASFKFSWTIALLPMAEEIARDQAAAGAIFAGAEADRQAAVQLATARTQMERDIMAARAEAKREQWDGFWADVKASARQMIYNVMVDAIASLDGKQSMPPSNREALRRLVDAVKDTQFWPDDEIEAQMRQVRTLLSAIDASSRPNTERLSDLMKRIGATARMSLIDLNRPTLRDPKKKTGEDVGIPEERAALAIMLGQKVAREPRSPIQVGMRAVTLPAPVARDIAPISSTPQKGGE